MEQLLGLIRAVDLEWSVGSRGVLRLRWRRVAHDLAASDSGTNIGTGHNAAHADANAGHAADDDCGEAHADADSDAADDNCGEAHAGSVTNSATDAGHARTDRRPLPPLDVRGELRLDA